MTKQEAIDLLPMYLSIKRYVSDQPISYEKKQVLETLYTLIQAAQEAAADEWTP